MLDGPFNDIYVWDYAALPAVLGAGLGFTIRTEDALDGALEAAAANSGTFTILDVHLGRDDISPALRRLTAALRDKVR